jgi:hypothetical protein
MIQISPPHAPPFQMCPVASPESVRIWIAGASKPCLTNPDSTRPVHADARSTCRPRLIPILLFLTTRRNHEARVGNETNVEVKMVYSKSIASMCSNRAASCSPERCQKRPNVEAKETSYKPKVFCRNVGVLFFLFSKMYIFAPLHCRGAPLGRDFNKSRRLDV